MPSGTDVTIVTMAFETSRTDELLGLLAPYVVMSRGHPGCVNIDLCVSVTEPSRIVVIAKWASPEAQRRHFDSPAMVEMAAACRVLLSSPPSVDLLEGISAHDLR